MILAGIRILRSDQREERECGNYYFHMLPAEGDQVFGSFDGGDAREWQVVKVVHTPTSTGHRAGTTIVIGWYAD